MGRGRCQFVDVCEETVLKNIYGIIGSRVYAGRMYYREGVMRSIFCWRGVYPRPLRQVESVSIGRQYTILNIYKPIVMEGYTGQILICYARVLSKKNRRVSWAHLSRFIARFTTGIR